MAIRKKVETGGKLTIDITGPAGNAYNLLGQAGTFAKQMGLDNAAIQADMTSGDYEHLLEVFDTHFGDVCDLLR